MNLLRVIGGARLGEEASVTISIPPNDSPLGQFGFQKLEVSLNDLLYTYEDIFSINSSLSGDPHLQ